jgi:polyphosphate kinase
VSDNIRVTSVVGRFLEHSRIYHFENAGDPTVLIGSADLMRRNLDRRVEVLAPVLDVALVAELETVLDTYLADNVKAWELKPDGTYERVVAGPDEADVDAQEALLERAKLRECAE